METQGHENLTAQQHGDHRLMHHTHVPICSLVLAGSRVRGIFLPVLSGFTSTIRHRSTGISDSGTTVCGGEGGREGGGEGGGEGEALSSTFVIIIINYMYGNIRT